MNTTRTRLQHTGSISPGQYLNRGNRAYQAGRYDDALEAYESYAAALPDVAQPHCLKGDALAALGRFEEANLAYTRALENLDQPVYLGGQVIVNQELIGNMMSRALYYNRGNVHAAADDHRAAVADFDAALLHGYSPKRDVLHNRGSSVRLGNVCRGSPGPRGGLVGKGGKRCCARHGELQGHDGRIRGSPPAILERHRCGAGEFSYAVPGQLRPGTSALGGAEWTRLPSEA